MVALAPGTRAPDFSLRTLAGEEMTLSGTLRNQPAVVLAFYKVSCPVCQFAFPYIERLHQQFPSIPIWGVSQDDAAASKEFAATCGLTFPQLLDERLQVTVDYGLTNVPTVFLVAAGGTIERTIVGFVKADLDDLSVQLAACAGAAPRALFTPADDVPALRPG